jgi:hypothetical protein
VRYLTYKLVFLTAKYGFGPEPRAAEEGATLVASSFVDGNGTHLGYLTGDCDLSVLSAWSATEVSQAAALAFAQALNADAYLLDDGIITVPMEEA